MRIIVGITGASGVQLGYELVKALKRHPECEVHVVVTEGAKRNFELESDITIDDVYALADYYHDDKNMAASISSGSFVTDGMIVVPCSMKTLSAIATGYSANLVVRAADVCLKENRRVVLVPREMPFGKIHLRNMQTAADLGCTIVAPVLTFYNNPQTLEDQMNHIIGKILMQFGLTHKQFSAWTGDE